MFDQAKKCKNSVIFFDEIDALCPNRTEKDSDSSRRIKTELLVQMQGMYSSHDGVFVLASTNRPWELDPAIRRRFEKRILVALPNEEDRVKIFKLYTSKTPMTLDDDDWKEIGKCSDGYSPSDICNVAKDAIMQPIRAILSATHFKRIGDVYSVANKSDKGAFSSSFDLINPELLGVPMVTKNDFLSSLSTMKKSLSESDSDKINQFAREFGTGQ